LATPASVPTDFTLMNRSGQENISQSSWFIF